MTDYFYTDAGGQRRGPYDEQQQKTLAARKIIGPNTLLETGGGHRGMPLLRADTGRASD